MKKIGIYVHIPFCEQKCNYCAFASFCVNQAQIEDYLNDLCDEIKRRKVENPIKTIYFGGGTPSMLSPEQFKRVVDVIFQNYNVYDNAEFTVEANPNSITQEKLDMWKSLRVNRLSIGVQTLKEKNGLNDYLNLGVVINSKAFYNELNAFLKKLKGQ